MDINSIIKNCKITSGNGGYGSSAFTYSSTNHKFTNCYILDCKIYGKRAFGFTQIVGNGCTYTNCYSNAEIYGELEIAGLIYTLSGTGKMTACFWDTQKSGVTFSAAGTGKTTAEMYNLDTYSAWDTNTIWYADNYSYPELVIN
jgi:hypothetical protein